MASPDMVKRKKGEKAKRKDRVAEGCSPKREMVPSTHSLSSYQESETFGTLGSLP